MAETETLPQPQGSAEEEDVNIKEDQPMPDTEDPSDDSDTGKGSESESDSESEGEGQTKAQVEALETALSSNPLDYDSHVQYIKILRKQGELDKVRHARETMSTLFPLSPEMWKEWAKDEISVMTGVEGFTAVEKLYEWAVSDYLSVSLWCDYLNFVEENDPSVRECSTSGIAKARNLFERALSACGLHVTEGHQIWELYREFEQAILLTIDETDSESKEKQILRLRNLFHRQLAVPLADNRSALLTYKAWEADNGSSVDANSSDLDGLPSNVVSAYPKALNMLNARALFEERISKQDIDPSEKLKEFMMYLKFELASGDPSRIQVLYERAIAEFPVSSDLWIEYTQYLDKTFKTARVVRDAYCRATRNCPWVGELWVRYLLCLERSHGSEEELTTVFEKSLQCSFSSFDEYLNIFLTRVDGLRRRMSASKQVENDMNYAVIRDVFQRASEYLSLHFKNTDSLLHLHSYWARLESKLGKDLTAARGVWESLLKISGSTLEAWQGYIAMEIEMGHINEARSLYKRCYSKKFPGTGSEDICHSWVRFEREYGSLEEFDIAVQKITPRLQELQLFRLQQESKNVSGPIDDRENCSRKNTREKRNPASSSIGEGSPSKRRKDLTEGLLKRNEGNKGLKPQSAEASKADQSDASKTEVTSSNETKYKFSKGSGPFDDQCTAFVSNLSLQAKDDDLHNFFADVGGVVAIRILKDKFTKKSRGLAYVDFCDDAHLASAVVKNKQIFMGKKISILKSDPQQGRRKKGEGHGSRSEHGKGGSGDAAKERRPEDKVQLKGKNTFAVPRNVRALGWSGDRSTTPSEGAKERDDETPKSNDDFRKMLQKT